MIWCRARDSLSQVAQNGCVRVRPWHNDREGGGARREVQRGTGDESQGRTDDHCEVAKRKYESLS
jgi:hypothetical protein